MCDPIRQISKCYSLWVLTYWVLCEGVSAYVYKCVCSNIVRNIANFLGSRVSADKTRLHHDFEIIVNFKYCACCLSVVIGNTDL